jgi:hypothetical protein
MLDALLGPASELEGLKCVLIERTKAGRFSSKNLYALKETAFS